MDTRHIESQIDAGAHLIPYYMIGAVKRYIINGNGPGSFLTAVICNNLRDAVNCGDEDNQRALAGWVKFFYNYTPSACWGSPDAYREWQTARQAERGPTL